MPVSSRSTTLLKFSSKAAALKDAKSIGVALGPGLPIGMVSVGMLIALEELYIPIRMISGTSMGAILGALYAGGSTAEELRQHAIEIFSDNNVMKLISEDKSGFSPSSGEKLMEDLRRRAGWDPEFYELKIPLYVVAADRISQKNVILRQGKVWDAVRASIAMPLLLDEKEIGGMKLADGAIFYPLDTDVLYSEGSDFVIAIQAKPIKSMTDRKLPLRTKLQPKFLKKLGWQVSEEKFFAKPGCDILLRPRVPMDLAKDTSRINEIIALGYKITYNAVMEIEKGNFQPRSLDEKEKKAVEETIVRFSREAEIEASDIERYLQKLEKKTANMADAELMDEFPKFAKKFGDFYSTVTENFPEVTSASQALRSKIKDFAKLVDQSPFMSRCLRKPQGYAGDYQMMNYMYDNQVFDSQTNMGKLLNYYLFSNPASNAVRNRAKIIQGLIQQRASVQTELAITSIACGPSREVTGTLEFLKDNTNIVWTLLDQDNDALANARKNIPKDQRLTLNFVNAGVRDLLKKSIDLGQQDILYSLGLFDYLEDKIAITLISRLYAFLKPGGLMLIGNFDTRNPSRALMEGLMEWFLIHRTEEEMLELGKQGAPDGRHSVIAEPEGINLI
ncbi:methyltransferase domain-containing protein, partial [candidate division KSB1 bacterium]|nr:methyltransferase domain-containing protein [candidate division KSB1 bacterium]NIR72129.1 methyltransferase domain-containing protein [candidate division KSB1 bacterium]NIS26591.1 methyltransferase domain-containing protein [candidate division KSB1 bacterium]NIT69575.1 methyltransferase domain-containing protein [candidate division KSB1 bacterium]NIU27207.1 methyltransferase domain-containing protein [candidate division KSB1 bacterium]